MSEADTHNNNDTIEILGGNPYFRHPLVETVDRLYRSRVRERQYVRPQAHDVAVLSVQVDVCPLSLSASDVEVSPPIGVPCQRVPGVFVQTIVEFIPGQT